MIEERRLVGEVDLDGDLDSDQAPLLRRDGLGFSPLEINFIRA